MGDHSLKPCAVLAPIQDGTVTGVLPETEAFAVHYPGYPSSIARAVDTLGGLDEIAKARSSASTTPQSSSLELRFRPEDPYSRPVVGDLRPCTALLLKISQSAAAKPQLFAGIVGRVNQEYKFEGMADYQHVVGVHAAEAARNKRPRQQVTEPAASTSKRQETEPAALTSKRQETEAESEREKIREPDPEDLMMILPKFFSLKNRPEKLALQPSVNLFSKCIQKGVVENRWEMDVEPCLAIAFDTERIPAKVNWEDNIQKGTDEWECHLTISKLFEERPIWPRRSIHEQLIYDGLQVSDHQLKRLLFRTGYYFSTGPFERFWIRKGYDPRKDPETRIYQKVDFRMHHHFRHLVDGNTHAKSKQNWKDICQFRVFPTKSFVCLQLFELDDDFIRQEIRKPLARATCSHVTGWLTNGILKVLRLRVAIRFLSIFPNKGTEGLLKSTCEAFERAKKMEALIRFRKSEKGHRNVDKGIYAEVLSIEPNSLEQQHEDGPNDAETGDEEEEEELDGYESPHSADEDATFALDPRSFQTGQSIPSDYLQNLLRGFPLSSGGGDEQSNGAAKGADLSDGEYEIFEQDSDASSDDDF